MTLVINTPNGNIGRRAAHRLLDSRLPLRVVSRNPEKVSDLTERGASVVVGSIDDEELLNKAFDGADAVFWLTPPAYRPDYADWVRQTAEKAARALKSAGVSRVVNVSSMGTQAGSGTGPIALVGEAEKIFDDALANVVHLRPGSFMENHFGDVPTLAAEGKIYNSMPPDAPAPKIATRDIGDVAATYLMTPEWSGRHVRELFGPRLVTPRESAEMIGEGIGRPVQYVEVPLEQQREAMAQAGVPGFVVDLYVEILAAIREGRVAPESPRTPEGVTPTGLVEFAREFLKPAVESAG